MGGAGALLLLIAGTFMPLTYLKVWGLPISLCGFFLITLGLLPYRRLNRIANRPHTLEWTHDGMLYSTIGKPLFLIPHNSIAKLEYVEREKMYGVALYLKQPLEEKVKVVRRRFDFIQYSANCFTKFQCDLFFPYFTERSVSLFQSE
ncbi:MAG: hypothetical protein ACKVOH_01165 [Chlamydiales bacterium]